MRFHTLDSWRGVCAILVALMHFPFLGHQYMLPFVRDSYLFVDFFFVLSGFVITHAYGGKLGDWRSAGRFMVRRIGRVWPLHIFALSLFVALELAKYLLAGHLGGAQHAPFTGATSIETLFTNIFLIHATGIHDVPASWNGPSWSISAEFIVYGLFALVTIAFGSRRAVVLVVLSAVCAAVLLTLSPKYMNAAMDFGLARCVFGFTVGHLVYLLHQRQARQSGGVPKYGSWIEAACLTLVGLFIAKVGQTPLSVTAPLLFGVVVHVFASGDGIFTGLLSTRPFRLLGELSFSIYMMHGFLIEMLLKLAGALEKTTGWPVKVTLPDESVVVSAGGLWATDTFILPYLAAVVIVSWFTYRLIELPGQRLFNNLRIARPRIEAPQPAL
ncbi:acyltransferase family protein [Skermanella stibiiresistens]|nr:acyltransferase [Skermanella stibiiresistens]